MAKYTYSGPFDTIELTTTKTVDGDAVKTTEDVRLVPGAQVTLPEDHKLVKRMIAAGHLKPVEQASAKQTATAAAQKSTTGKVAKATDKADEGAN